MITLKQLQDLRNQLHKDIVLHTVKAGGADMYELELQDSVHAAHTVLDRTGLKILEEVEIQAIDGVTGELIAIAADGLQKHMRYNDLSLEQLTKIYEQLDAKNYKLLILEEA